jgi:hypothetical protein
MGVSVGSGVGVTTITTGVGVGGGVDTCVGVGDGAITIAEGKGVSSRGTRVDVGIGTNPNSRKLGYAEPGALARELPRSSWSWIRLFTALIICPVVANSEVIAAGVGVVVGVGVSVEIGKEVEVAVTLAEEEVPAGVVSVPGVEVLVVVNVGEVVGSVVGVGETAGVVVDGAVGVGAGARLAIAITWSRSLRACWYSDNSIRTLALSYNVAGFSPFNAIAPVYSATALSYCSCLASFRPSNQPLISPSNFSVSSVASRLPNASTIAFKRGPVLSVPSVSASVVYSPLIRTISICLPGVLLIVTETDLWCQ